MNIAIIGASGFIGKNLTNYLLQNTSHNIKVISRSTDNNIFANQFCNRVKIICADVLNIEEMKDALQDVDVAYYLVHQMAHHKHDFMDSEVFAAEATGLALKHNRVEKVIYLGGLGKDGNNLSKHLASRHKTGEILSKYNPVVIEFRASIIIGEGSISFEIIRNIVNKSKVILLPALANTKTQPIGLSDVLSYLTGALDSAFGQSEIIEIGGPESMSYEKLIRDYSNYKQKNVYIRRLPFLSCQIAGLFLGFFNNKKETAVGRCMVESFKNEMILTNNHAMELFPNIKPKKVEEYFI